jgi:hypothetical protein
MIYLTAVGLTPGGGSTSHIYTQTVHLHTNSSLFTLKHEPLLQSLSVFSGLYTLKKRNHYCNLCVFSGPYTLKHGLLPLPLIVFKRLLYSFSIWIHFSDYGLGGGWGGIMNRKKYKLNKITKKKQILKIS